MAVLGLGPRKSGRAYGAAERTFLRSVVACLAAGLESARLAAELERAHRRRSADVVQLHDLLDISRELGGAAEEGEVHDVVVRAALGHFVVQRCGLFLLGAQGLALAHGRGLPSLRAGAPVPPEEARAGLQGLLAPTPVADLPEGALRQSLARSRLVLAVPLAEQAGTAPHPIGVLAIGDRASGSRYTEEDCVFAQALARLAASAVGNVRLRRLREEKQRQDRELQVAREIQRSLFPARAPDLPGFAVAAVSRPCHEVGGDSYDWIALGRDRLALVVADVSGKGTPASLVMASVHAFVRAVAGTAPPVELVERLNRFLFASARSGRFVTLFYAELDGRAGRLTYVRAGHVPPFVLGCDGVLTRLVEGGPALGLLEAAR
jgi:sigma-B regulation protein RsbU (phosphoserine phosphatase)